MAMKSGYMPSFRKPHSSFNTPKLFKDQQPPSFIPRATISSNVQFKYRIEDLLFKAIQNAEQSAHDTTESEYAWKVVEQLDAKLSVFEQRIVQQRWAPEALECFCEPPKISGDLPGEYIDESYLDDFIEQELAYKWRYLDESCILS